MSSKEINTAHEIIGRGKLSTADAQLVDAELKKIESERGRLSSEETIREFIRRARDERSVIHHLFEWDPEKQIEEYLKHRAREIIMSVRVVFEERPEMPVRAYPVVVTGGQKGFYSMAKAVEDGEKGLLEAVIEQAAKDAVAWKKRYEHLRDVVELAGLFTAVDALEGTLRTKKAGGKR